MTVRATMILCYVVIRQAASLSKRGAATEDRPYSETWIRATKTRRLEI